MKLARKPFDVPVSKVMSEHLVCVKRDASIDEVRAAMLKKNISHVSVVDDQGVPIGMISKTDLLTRGGVGEAKTAVNLMTPGVVSVPSTTTIAIASLLMARRKLHGLVVTFDHDRGWLSASDVVRWVAEQSGGS